MAESTSGDERAKVPDHGFAVDIAHDLGGAILFSFPLLMTMEMWWLGFYMDRFRLALFLALVFLLVLGLSYFEGGAETFKIEVLDALVAFTAGYTVATVMLLLFGIIKPGMSADEIIGKISLHATPAAIGAILARRQLGVDETGNEKTRRKWYGARMFFMGVGAIFLAFQLAPTEEMVLIGHRMTGWHAAALAVVSLCVMQAFLYAVELRAESASAALFWSVFVHYTVVGYALALVISLYVLWTFGRLSGADLTETVMAMTVLGFPASLGASAARLIL